MSTAVLLLAYGGPNTPEDVPAYLMNVRGGRPTPAALVAEVTERYRLIGGGSPIWPITRSLAEKLQGILDLPVYIGMRHWKPYMSETIAEMAEAGVSRAVVICLAPHYSDMSIGAYRARLQEALAKTGNAIRVDFVESWHLQPEYLAGVETNVRETLQRFPENVNVKVIFTAHSLLTALIEHGDPYHAQLQETAESLAARLNLPRNCWLFAYQSTPRAAAQSLDRWLGPSIEIKVREMAEAQNKNICIAPIGFLTDHVEILYDLDIEVQRIAAGLGIHIERTPMLNDGPALVKALAAIVRQQLGSGTHAI